MADNLRFRNPELAHSIAQKIKNVAPKKGMVKFCHVCGTHEWTITHYGLRSLLPENVEVIAGPGCPVCIVPAAEIDEAVQLAQKGVVITCFGDVLRVPGSQYSLLEAKAAGAKVGVDNPQTSGKCLKCHSTAYNFTEAVATEKIKPEDGVTCESCHGPGKKFMAKSTMEDHAKAVEAGLVYPASKSCELCHNDQNPTWKPDRYTTKDGKKVGFDYEQAFALIKHPDPLVKH